MRAESDTHRWRVEIARGVTLLRCEPLLDLPGVAHAFSTRRADGRDDFDLGRPDPGDETAEARRLRFCDAAGLTGQSPTVLKQEHGRRVVRAGMVPVGDRPRADGALALRQDRPRRAVAVRVADCLPVLLADDEGRALAAVHAGWRGTACGIVPQAVEMLEALGVEACHLRAALGPSIGPCCYEVEADVVAAVARGSGVPAEALTSKSASGHLAVDLADANARQLKKAGLRAGSIFIAPWCTACTAELFFSHRRDGPLAGRLMACVGWT